MNHRNSARTLLDAISRFGTTPIGVVGDYMLDEYVLGTVARISPEAPVPVVEGQNHYWTLGGAGNVAMNIKALGGNPLPFGLIGNDIAGHRVKSSLQDESGISAEYVFVDSTRPTTIKTRIVAQHQQLLRIDLESKAAMSLDLKERMVAAVRREAPRLGALVVSDYGKGVVGRSVFDELLKLCLEADVPVILDPKAFDLTGVGAVTVITPNEREAEKFSGCRVDADTTAELAGATLIEKTGAKNILITRGEQGMSLFSARGEISHIPTRAREVYDVTGAGDTVVAVLALTLAAGADVDSAAHLANAAAGIVVGKMGTATVTRHELESAVDENDLGANTDELRSRAQAG